MYINHHGLINKCYAHVIDKESIDHVPNNSKRIIDFRRVRENFI